jgi:peptide/nickel transport system permease protein
MSQLRSGPSVAPHGSAAAQVSEVPPKRSAWRNLIRAFKRNPLAIFGVCFVTLVALLAILEPYLGLPEATKINLLKTLAPPSSEHLLGTDENGRDIFVRLIQGGRISLLVGLVGALLTVLIGATIGLVAGFSGGAIDILLMRITDGMMAVPLFFLVLVIVAIFGSSGTILVVTLALTRWMSVARLVRAEVLRSKHMDYVLAASSLGLPSTRIMLRHLFPAALPTTIVTTSLGVGEIMLVEAGLSFLGLGILPPTPSWGNMLSNSQYYIWSAPHLAIYPGLMILLAVLSFNAIGDALRDLLDPRSGAK